MRALDPGNAALISLPLLSSFCPETVRYLSDKSILSKAGKSHQVPVG
jgi:hypothetical protein